MEENNRFVAEKYIDNPNSQPQDQTKQTTTPRNVLSARRANLQDNDGQKDKKILLQMEQNRVDLLRKKLFTLVATKDIYEFTDEEKELYINFYNELFSHKDDDLGNCEFITSNPVAEAVLSDFFDKKERTKGMNFLFNFHTKNSKDKLDSCNKDML